MTERTEAQAKNRRATIYQVAEAAGCSHTTASIVLRGKAKQHSISEETVNRVLEAAEGLRYSPDFSAQALATGRTSDVIVLTRGTDHPANYRKLRSITRHLSSSGFRVIPIDMELWEEEEVLGEAFSRRPCGIVYNLAVPQNEVLNQGLKELQAQGTPIVSDNLGKFIGFDSVCVDVTGGCYEAILHLVELGHRRIAYGGPASDTIPPWSRYAGYTRAMDDSGIGVDSALIFGRTSGGETIYRNGYEMVCRFMDLPKPPTAILCYSDRQALGAMSCALRHGVRVPEDLALVGLDGDPGIEYAVVPLTTIEQPAEEFGRKIVERLVELTQAEQPQGVQEVVLKPRLIVRESTVGAGAQGGGAVV